ncbi:MAG: putative metal-dependent enzyme (double-stranded beta helix superfamily) [Arenicella sp.]|jgi:predicted metal-dependent enzyme (double-stranded beta helix superfamily)/SAM-dependent methyltransferase
MAESQAAVIAEPLKGLISKLKVEKGLKPSGLIRLLKEANVQAEDLTPWHDFNHPPEDSYGRKLIYQGENFELMVMSWKPGDFSTIHDHGNTIWGAVQIFGPAEHATFRMEDDHLTTLARWQVDSNDVLGVSHSLIHQMGNPTKDYPFASLHIYGVDQNNSKITGDSRIFDLDKGQIQRHDGGVFYGLKDTDINSVEPGLKSDFHTRLRHMVEFSRRLLKIQKATDSDGGQLESRLKQTYSIEQLPGFLNELQQFTDENGHVQNSIYWKNLNNELREASSFQDKLKDNPKVNDHFHQYAEMYDALICQPMLDNFMSNYLLFFKNNFIADISSKSIISIGVGTALIEKYMIDNMGVDYDNLYGIDISESMVEEACKRIHAEQGDVLTLDPSVKMWDITYSGLNVFHYIDYEQLEEAISKTAGITKKGGWFLGDFITPDHIRWYPNVIYSADKKIVSLRTPRLIEDQGRIFQESEIINVDFSGEQMAVNYAGKHKRFLPPMHRVRKYFEDAFGGQVKLFDAYSMELIPAEADTCLSTRYVVIAQKRNSK